MTQQSSRRNQIACVFNGNDRRFIILRRNRK
jgi:hypothetical protein